MTSNEEDNKSLHLGEEEVTAVSRRGLLRASAMAVGTTTLLAATLISERAAAGNMTQKASGYQATPNDGKRCDGCSLFIAPNSCKLVAGEISPSGWCRFYAKKA